MSPTLGESGRREIPAVTGQVEDNVPPQRESGDGASANPTESETTSAYQRRTKTRTGSLFDDDEDEIENADQPATAI